MNWLGIFLLSGLISYLVTPLVRKFALRFNILAYPSTRKIHTHPIPQAGGLAIYLGITLALVIAFYTGLIGDVVLRVSFLHKLKFLLLGSTFILVAGLLDDRFVFRAWQKLLAQIIGALILIIGGIKIEFLSNPFNGLLFLAKWQSIALSMLWIVGLTNAMNFMDGLDGLLAGISGISAIVLSIVAFQTGQLGVAFVLISIAGSALGFLRYNFNPAKIFMGDTGSLTLGYILAGLSIMGALKSTTTLAVGIPLLVFGVPIFDITYAIFRRFKKREPIFKPDKEHLHHKLLKLGLTQVQAVILIYFICGLLGIAALAINSCSP